MKNLYRLSESDLLQAEILSEQVAQEMHRQKASRSLVDAIMYIRSIVGIEFDETLHRMAKRAGDNLRKSPLGAVE